MGEEEEVCRSGPQKKCMSFLGWWLLLLLLGGYASYVRVTLKIRELGRRAHMVADEVWVVEP